MIHFDTVVMVAREANRGYHMQIYAPNPCFSEREGERESETYPCFFQRDPLFSKKGSTPLGQQALRTQCLPLCRETC